MAHIKSSLEIALERAAAMVGDKSEDDTLEREEGKKQGAALARKVLLGDVAPSQMIAEMEGLGSAGQEEARKAATEIFLEAIPEQAAPALGGLGALGGRTPAFAAIHQAMEALQQAVIQLDQEAMEHLSRELAEAGISGSAVHPNPAAFGDWEDMAAQRLHGPLSDLERAKAGYAEQVTG